MHQPLVFHCYYFLVIVKNKGQFLSLSSYPIKIPVYSLKRKIILIKAGSDPPPPKVQIYYANYTLKFS